MYSLLKLQILHFKKKIIRHNNFMLNGEIFERVSVCYIWDRYLWYLLTFFQITWALNHSSSRGTCYTLRLPPNQFQCTHTTGPSDMADLQVPSQEISRPFHTRKWREKRGDLWLWRLSIPDTCFSIITNEYYV